MREKPVTPIQLVDGPASGSAGRLTGRSSPRPVAFPCSRRVGHRRVGLVACLIVLSPGLAGCVLIGYDREQRPDGSAGSEGQGDAAAGRGDAAVSQGDAAASRGDGSTQDDEDAGSAGENGATVQDAADGDPGQGDAGDASGSEGNLDAAEPPVGADCTTAESFCDGTEFVTCSHGAEVSREECALVTGHEQECKIGACHPVRGCELTNAENHSECDDGLFCTVGEHCKKGICSWGSENTCASAQSACRAGVCNEEADRCDTEPTKVGGACGENATCNAQGLCVGGGEMCSGMACAISCNSRVSRCSLTCSGARSCRASCGAGVDCAVDCTGSEELCRVKCVQGSLCDIDCSESSNCGPIECEAAAQCILRCAAQNGTCAFSECVGEEPVWCPDSNTWVCHRP